MTDKEMEKIVKRIVTSPRYLYENSDLTLEEFENQYTQIDALKAEILKFVAESRVCSLEDIIRHASTFDKVIVQFVIRSLKKEGKLNIEE